MQTYSDRKNNAEHTYDYDVALSFAGEHREYVKQVAEHLKSMSINVFYDEDEIINNWGQSGIEVFYDVYFSRSKYVVMFISKEYVKKSWTKIESQAVLSRMLNDKGDSILPVRMDDTPVPGLPADRLYLSAREINPAQLSAAIVEKLGVSRSDQKDSDSTLPSNSSLSGEVTFDYSNFDGRFVLGKRPLEFETMWTKASNTNIHAYNDPPSIDGIAVALNFNTISQIKRAASLDYSSRSRTVQVNEILVLRNVNDFYAAVRILGIKDRTRGADRDELKFQFAIQPNGSDDFSDVNVQNWTESQSDHKSEIFSRVEPSKRDVNRYRRMQTFDDIDRSDFRKEAYACMQDYFKSAISEINEIEGLRGRFRSLSTDSFSCTIVNKDYQYGTSHITVHGGTAAIGDLSYSFEESASPNSANGFFAIEADEYSLYLRPTMEITNQQESMTPKEAAENLWSKFVEQGGITKVF